MKKITWRRLRGDASRPFKVEYEKNWEKVGRISSCSTPEGVIRSAAFRVLSDQADSADVYLHGELFASLYILSGMLKLEIHT